MGNKNKSVFLDNDLKTALMKPENKLHPFNAVFSNPPYQIDTGSGSAAIYQHFVDAAELIGEYISLIFPSRWMNNGRGEGLSDLRERALTSTKYIHFRVISGQSEIFTNANIKGGICYSLWNADKTEPELTYYYNNEYAQRKTLSDGMNQLIQRNSILRIANKVNAKKFIAPEGGEYYGSSIRTDTRIKALSENSMNKELTVYYSSTGGGLFIDSIDKEHISKPVDDYKVFISSTASHDVYGSLRRPGRIFIGEPNDVCSNSFLKFGSFSKRETAENAIYYLKTDFATFLLGAIIPTQHAYRKSYSLIPDVDFETGEIKDKPGVFLDFGNFSTLDEQLATIYELDEDDKILMSGSIRHWKDKLSLISDGNY